MACQISTHMLVCIQRRLNKTPANLSDSIVFEKTVISLIG